MPVALPSSTHTGLGPHTTKRIPLTLPTHYKSHPPPPPSPLGSFLIYNQSTELLGGLDIGVLVSCLTGLLKHTHLVTSPPVHQGIVQLLLAMLSPQVCGWGWDWWG